MNTVNRKALTRTFAALCVFGLQGADASDPWPESEMVRMTDAPLSVIVGEFNRLNPKLKLKIEGESLRARRFAIALHYSDAKLLAEYLKKDPELEVIDGNSEIIVRERARQWRLGPVQYMCEDPPDGKHRYCVRARPENLIATEVSFPMTWEPAMDAPVISNSWPYLADFSDELAAEL